jgi:hypothetical protein
MMGNVAGAGGGGNTCLEQFIFYDPHDSESVRKTLEFCHEATKLGMELGIGAGLEALSGLKTTGEAISFMGGGMIDMYRWQRKIKETFDPNDVGDSSYVVLRED